GLFSNSLAICSYSFRDGNHRGGNHDYPILCAGNGGGFKTGYHHRVIKAAPRDAGKGSEARSPSNLWVSILKKYGINYNDGTVTGNCDQFFS
ncbi:MAG: hypothetical protein KDD22_00605, partial [Bdellovibrionales bacterium]|nr:hypothetical protein [Bdellovibrionales bacterium]